MRFAFISDLHGNLHALELVLADLRQEPVDELVCLGDVASLGPQPREVLACLKQLRIPVIMGNHDTYLLNPQLTEKQHPWVRAAEQWCLARLSEDDLGFVRSFRPSLSMAAGPDTTLLCFHGSPRSNEEWLYPTTTSEQLDEIFAEQNASIWVGGHTHAQLVHHTGETFWSIRAAWACHSSFRCAVRTNALYPGQNMRSWKSSMGASARVCAAYRLILSISHRLLVPVVCRMSSFGCLLG